MIQAIPATLQDFRIRQQAFENLHESGYSALRTVDCRVDNGVVHLLGLVPTFYLKQMAQALVLRVDGVSGLRNSLRVCSPGAPIRNRLQATA